MRIPAFAAVAAIVAAALVAGPGSAPAGAMRPAEGGPAGALIQIPMQPSGRAAVAAVAAAPAVPAAPAQHHPAAVRSRALGARAHTGWTALDQAIAQLKYFYPGLARWHVADRGGWGTTNLNTGDIYIAARTPADKLVSVVEHEYAHAITGHLYGGFDAAVAAADRYFGQTGEYGLEVEADCMALVEGATWTWYSPCRNDVWRAQARRLLHNRRLP